MEEHVAASSGACLLPRCARILKPGTYGSSLRDATMGKHIVASLTHLFSARFA
jgi:hypothetical protein